MESSKQRSAAHINKLLADAVLPRNQIATISGISNTYIRDLQKGNIAKVSRSKLVALAVALNLRLVEIDELLVVFRQPPLSPDDVDLFIEKFDSRKFTTAIIPIRDFFAYELMTNAITQIPGEQIIVNDRPALSLRAQGHRSYTDANLVESHPMYGELVEAIGRKREQTMANSLFQWEATHYICKDCLEDYVRLCSDREEQKFRARHIRNMLNYVRTFPKLHIHLTGICSSHLFTLKYPSDPQKHDVTISFSARPGHFVKHDRSGRLSGFATKNPVMIRNFEAELKSIKASVLEAFADLRALEAYLQGLVDDYLG